MTGWFSSVPVLATRRPSTAVPRNSIGRACRSDPPPAVRPATRCLPTCWSTASIAAQVTRLSRLRPDPSSGRTPSIGTPQDRSVRSSGVQGRRSRVPIAESATPSSFSSISAVLLSLVVSISATIASSVADWIEAISAAAGSATPTSQPPPTRDAALAEQSDQLARGGLVRIGLSARAAERARVVDHQCVVRPGFDPGDALAPGVDLVLVVVPAAVADHRAVDAGDPGVHQTRRRAGRSR